MLHLIFLRPFLFLDFVYSYHLYLLKHCITLNPTKLIPAQIKTIKLLTQGSNGNVRTSEKDSVYVC